MTHSHWLAAGLLLFAGAAQAAPFQNGSFEIGSSQVVGGFSTLPAGNTSISGWTVVGDGVDYISSGFWEASDESYSLDLLACGVSGGIEQTFDTVNGADYQVTFDLAGNPDISSQGIKVLTVTAAGVSGDFTFDTTGRTNANMGWESHTLSFTATASSTTLRFVGGVSGGVSSCAGSALDNVRVTLVNQPQQVVQAVPVSGAAWGAGVLMMAVGGLMVRRRR